MASVDGFRSLVSSPPRHLLFCGDVVEGLIAPNRPSQGDACTNQALIRFVRIQAQRRRAVQGAVLDKGERIAVDAVYASSCLNVNGATRATATLRGETVIDDLETTDGFGRELGPASPVYSSLSLTPSQIDRIAPWPEPAEAAANAARR